MTITKEQKDKATELLTQSRTLAWKFAKSLNKLQSLGAEPELLDTLTKFCDTLDTGTEWSGQMKEWRLYNIRASVRAELNQIELHGNTRGNQ